MKNNTLNLFNCNACKKNDVCKYTNEYKLIEDAAKQIKEQYSSCPIELKVNCTSFSSTLTNTPIGYYSNGNNVRSSLDCSVVKES